MIAFEVHRNGEKLCTAGVSDGVLTAILTWVGGKKREEEAVQHGGAEGVSRGLWSYSAEARR